MQAPCVKNAVLTAPAGRGSIYLQGLRDLHRLVMDGAPAWSNKGAGGYATAE